MSVEYDFEDPKIRDMVNRHWPQEVFDPATIDVAGNGTAGNLRGIMCDTCRVSWPCRAIRGLRAWQKENGEPIE